LFCGTLGLLACISTFAANVPEKDKPEPLPNLFTLRPFDMLPVLRAARMLPIAFPSTEPVAVVEHLATANGKVWAIAMPRGITNRPPQSGLLWVFDPDANHLSPIGGNYESHFPNSVVPYNGEIWSTLDNEVVSLDADRMILTKFGPPQGITGPWFAGLAPSMRTLFALSEEGVLFRLDREGKAWTRLQNAAPGENPKRPAECRFFAASGDWLLALGNRFAAARHVDAPEWAAFPTILQPIQPGLETAQVRAVAGDGDGGFWIGTDAGLYRLLAETGSIEEHLHPVTMDIRGGLDAVVPRGFQPSAGMYAESRQRVMDQVRSRMLMRARYARVGLETKKSLSPVVPSSRVAGGVTALLMDNGFLWVATTDGPNIIRGRISVMHIATRKWLGWFGTPAPIRSLAADRRVVWAGLDLHYTPSPTAILAIDKAPILATPAAQWIPDAIAEKELTSKASRLPPKEQTVYHFFAGDYEAVSNQLGGTNQISADDQSLFLLAAAYDPIGLDQPVKLDETIDLLKHRFPKSVFAELAERLRPHKAIAAAAGLPEAVPLTALDAMKQHDVDGDGKLSAIELKVWLGDRFKLESYDADGDGKLDLQELDVLLPLISARAEAREPKSPAAAPEAH
jgi:hypothetical protein